MRVRMIACSALLALASCATVTIRPEDMPPGAGVAVRPSVVVVEQLDPVALAEVRALAPGTPEVQLPDGTPLGRACTDADGVAVRPRVGRRYFVTNTGDRNAFFIYETAVVVGIPVALIGSVASKWWGEITQEGALETAACGSDALASRVVESFHLRSEGRGFIRGATVQESMQTAATRGVMRKVFTSWAARRSRAATTRVEGP